MKLPVGLTNIFVSSSIRSLQIGRITFSRMSLLIVAWSICAECWFEITIVSILFGLSFSYSIVTWLLPSGPRYGISSIFLTSASLSVSLCASWIGRGISSGVSSQAYPNIIPWSPAPCSWNSPVPSVTPWLMSGDCSSRWTRTAQVSYSIPWDDFV